MSAGAAEHAGGATGVRILDDGVHRRTGPWTPAVHELLDHARRSGLTEAPDVVGFDERGDEVLRFLPGACDAHALLDDAALAAVGTLLTRLRVSLRSFPFTSSMVWRTKGAGSEVAHGDVAPWNLVFDGDRIVALLDWDFAGPNVPTYDVAYAAWTCVPLEPDRGVAPEECARRLALLTRAADLTDDERAALLTTVAYAQARVAFHIAEGGMSGELGLPGIWQGGRRMGGIGRSMAWLDQHWELLEAALR